VAALAVVVAHIEAQKKVFGFGATAHSRLEFLGQTGVSLFFVLSGYLITFLLLVERSTTATVDVKKFLVRRALRIWPLYFVILALGFFVLPLFSWFDIPGQTEHLHRHFGVKLLLFLVFQPNLALILFAPIAYASQSWSIGIEEQFYVVWPFVMRRVKNATAVAVGAIVAVTLARAGVELVRGGLTGRGAFLAEVASRFFLYSRYDCMAVGALFAVLAFEGRTPWLRSRSAALLSLGLSLLFFLLDASLPLVGHLPQALGFGLLVTNLAHGPRDIAPFAALEHRALMYCGKISYGIYMYHLVAITVAAKATSLFVGTSAPVALIDAVFYGLALGLTIGVAALSYRLLEKPFLRFKDSFTVIRSGAAG
jgi:peptidoglycan/LPS O-acetylase OafA/YrhL